MNTEENTLLVDIDEPIDRSPDVESVALQRLIEEVRSTDSIAGHTDYNRTYNRHNR